MIEQNQQFQQPVNSVKKDSKPIIIGSIIAAVVLLLGFLGFQYIQSQPKSIVAELKIKYDGYSGYGTLTYNSEVISKKIRILAYQKVGFSAGQIKDILNQDNVTLSEISENQSLKAKFVKANAMIESIHYGFDKSSDLKNGDKVVFRISSSSSTSPVKSEKKTFTVSKLKKTKEISIDELLKEYPVTFKGYNNYGTVDLHDGDNEYYMDVFELHTKSSSGKKVTDSRLKNGDKITIRVTSDYSEELESDGKVISPKTKELEVSGLKELSSISNFGEALNRNDTYVKSIHESGSFVTYTIEKQSDYIGYNVGYFYNSDISKTPTVSLISVYKITRKYKDSDSNTQYVYHGYGYHIKSDGSLDISNAEGVSSSETEDLESLTSKLKTEGYSEYKSS